MNLRDITRQRMQMDNSTETTEVTAVNMATPTYEIMKTEADQKQHMSNRYNMWEDFAKSVGDHVESYTVPQYGDYPNDQLTEWDLNDIATTIKRYANRIGKNARGEEDGKLDMMKIAHYASVAWHKMCDTEKDYNGK
jgi:hypothetical protein